MSDLSERHDVAVKVQARIPAQPPEIPLPKAIQGIGFIAARIWMMQQAARRYGPVCTMNIPIFGRTVVVADPALV
ncbi:MAG: cytochrome P450, partial [Mycobacteriaceae bacterium]|nr:cytochrome P450 [Mycobacteriaceae bacterium]